MIKKVFSFLFISLMFFTNNANAADVIYKNDRFNNIYSEARTYFNEGYYEKSKEKLYEYLDKTNFVFCDGFSLLTLINKRKSLEYSGVYENIYHSCEAFNKGDFKSAFSIIRSIDISNYDNLELNVIFNIYYYSIVRITKSEGYETLYFPNDVLNFLETNKDFLINNFPLTYGVRLSTVYYETENVEKFNEVYNNFLKDKDYYYKIITEMNYQVFNGYEIKKLYDTFKYENIVIEDKTLGNYNLDIYRWVEPFMILELSKPGKAEDVLNNPEKYSLISKDLFSYVFYINYHVLLATTCNNIFIFNFFKDKVSTTDFKNSTDFIKAQIADKCEFKSKTIEEFYFPFLQNTVNFGNFLSTNIYYNPPYVRKLISSLDFFYQRNDYKGDDPLILEVKNTIIKVVQKLHTLYEKGEIHLDERQKKIINDFIKLIPELNELKGKFDVEPGTLDNQGYSNVRYISITLVVVLFIIILGILILKRK